ncbi:MAG: calcium-binding protein [Microcoleaceae cyanobacterium]
MSQVPSPSIPNVISGGTILLPIDALEVGVQFSNSQSTGDNPIDRVEGSSGSDTLSFAGATTGLRLSGVSPILETGFDDAADSIVGGAANDLIFAYSGADTVYGGAGVDQIYGGSGDDELYGGADDDRIFGDGGDDVIVGEAGDDTLIGLDGADTILGGDGNDTAFGNQDDDLIQGGAGNDTIYGGGGNDTIQGGSGNDSLFGDKGNDRLVDTEGGSDSFGFGFTGSDNADTVVGFEPGTDQIVLGTDTFSSLGASVEDSEFTVVDTDSEREDADTPLVYVRETGELFFEGEQVAIFVGNPEITVDDFEIF